MPHSSETPSSLANEPEGQDYFDSSAWGTAEEYSREVLTDILAVLPADAQRILDVGCGDGFITDRLPADRDVMGCDFSAVALSHVRRPTRLVDISSLPFADGSFDLVMANDVIEHIEEEARARALAEIARVADRYVIITVPFTEWLARGWTSGRGRKLHVNRHYASFDFDAMRQLLSGFRLSRVLFSGVEWEDETAGVEILRRAERDGPGEPVRPSLLEAARRRQAVEFCAAPERIDRLRRRTEIMGLFVREGAEWPRAFEPGIALDYDDARARGERRSRHVIEAGQFGALAKSFAPLASETPYVVVDSGAEIAEGGVRFDPPLGVLKFGFFAPVEEGATLALRVDLEPGAQVSVSQYLPGVGYRRLKAQDRSETAGEIGFQLALGLPSEHGYLFTAVVEGGGHLHRVELQGVVESCYICAPAGVRYLTREVEGAQLAVSLRGEERRVPDWFAHAEALPARRAEFTDDLIAQVQMYGASLGDDPAQIALTRFALDDAAAQIGLTRVALDDVAAGQTAMQQQVSTLDLDLHAKLSALGSRIDELSRALAVTDARSIAHSAGLRQLTSAGVDLRAGLEALQEQSSRSEARLDSLEASTHHLRRVMDIARRVLRPVTRRVRGLVSRPAASVQEPGRAPSTPVQESPAPHRHAVPGELPRAVTMLVPDDRIDRRVLLEARTLTRTGARVLVVAAPYPGEVDLDQAQFPEVDIIRIDTTRAAQIEADLSKTRLGSLDFDWKEVYFYTYQFLEAALSRGADLIVAHDLPVLPAAIAAADLTGARLVYDAHELYPEQEYFGQQRIELYRKVELALAPIPDAVLTVNKSIAEEMARRYSIDEPMVLLNAPDATGITVPVPRTRTLREAFGFPESVKLFLYQGSLSLNRNLEALVEAMSLVQDPDVRLVVMGPGADKRRELESIAATFGILDSRVFFHDAVPQTELLGYTASADVGVIPYPGIDLNTTMCTPNKLFEFLTCGLPILANDLPELRRFVADTGAGIVHPMTDAPSIAAAIDKMASEDLDKHRSAAGGVAPQMTWASQEAVFLDACLKATSRV